MTDATDEVDCSGGESCGCAAGTAYSSLSEVEFGDNRLDPDQLAVRAATFRPSSRRGPVQLASVAATAHLDVGTVRRVLDSFATTGNTRLNGST